MLVDAAMLCGAALLLVYYIPSKANETYQALQAIGSLVIFITGIFHLHLWRMRPAIVPQVEEKREPTVSELRDHLLRFISEEERRAGITTWDKGVITRAVEQSPLFDKEEKEWLFSRIARLNIIEEEMR